MVVTERFVVVVDTTISPETAAQVMSGTRSEVESSRHRTLLVVNTHGDWDHTWGNALFARPGAYRAPILGHALTGRQFENKRAKARLLESRKRHPGWYDTVELQLPTVEFEEGLTIQGGDLTVQLIPTPGHTPDHVSAWVPELQLLLAGDAAELPIPYLDGRSSLPRLRESLEAMLDLDPLTVLYCHGGDEFSPQLIRHNVLYFAEAERRCRAALSSGARAVEITPSSLDWPLAKAYPAGRDSVDEDQRAFYAKSHARAVKAMAQWLEAAPAFDG